MKRSIFLVMLLAAAGLASPVALAPEATAEVAFSPKGESLELIVQEIDGAKDSILVAAYSFTSKPIAQALLAAHKRGVRVLVVADKKSNGGKARYSAATFLANQGMTVRLNGSYAIFHHKFMVIDGTTLQTGSFNYSAAANNKNAENVLVLRGVPAIASTYTTEWKRLWDEAEPLAPKY